MRRAKIVATIGPASRSPERLRELMLAGMDVARVNMSHGTHESHAEEIQALRAVAAELNHPLAILLDLCGPKIRTGKLKDGQPIHLRANQRLTITTRDVVGEEKGDETIVATGYAPLPQDVKSGDRILFADGMIELHVEQVSRTDIVCRVINGGELGENKGINVPGVKLSAPSLTEKDRVDLSFGLQQKVDYVALSFVRSARDCIGAKTLIEFLGADTPLIAKIEKREALDDLDNIIDACDGVIGGAYNFAISAGALPTGLSLNSATGVISGTPTLAGTYNFTVTATGWGSCSGSRAYSFAITNACPMITLPTLPDGNVGQMYNSAVAASPASTYSYTLTGTLPPGVSFYNSAGLLFGFPAAAGTYNFSITATDANNCSATRSYSVTVAP